METQLYLRYHENGHISPALAKRLLEVRLDEISKSGKVVFTDLEIKSVQVIMDQLGDQGETMMDDGTLCAK